MSHRFVPPSECPVCGADVPRNARACPECGADERSGWDEEAARYDGLDLPGEPDGIEKSRATRSGIPVFWWVIGVIVLVLFVGLTIRLFPR